MNEKAEVIPKSDPSSSDQVNFIAAATQRYVNSVDPGELPEGGAVPVIEIDENENAKKKTLARYFSGFCFIIFSYVLNCPSIPSQILRMIFLHNYDICCWANVWLGGTDGSNLHDGGWSRTPRIMMSTRLRPAKSSWRSGKRW